MRSTDSSMDILIQEALEFGATGAVILPARTISVKDKLAGKCFEPRCDGYGLSASCPPHVGGPEAMKEMLITYLKALFFKIDMPRDTLFSGDRWELFALLHQTAAGLEKAAKNLGFDRARAFAGGSCKQIFCADKRECAVTGEGGSCRNPDQARPSMSGFGIDVGALYETAGWQMSWTGSNADGSPVKMANLCGLVLVD